ncbi:MAG: hypothetical protein GY853_02340 [PVC group bacterium]|nr:hypothetical protein [PVC group bacterium]
MHQLKYIDHRHINIPRLKLMRGGVGLPSGDNLIKVTESEKRHLLKMKNGNNPCFEEVRERKPRIKNIDETKDLMEEFDGSRE